MSDTRGSEATRRQPLNAEQVDALVREFDEAGFVNDGFATAQRVAHKAFRDLVVTLRDAELRAREAATRAEGSSCDIRNLDGRTADGEYSYYCQTHDVGFDAKSRPNQCLAARAPDVTEEDVAVDRLTFDELLATANPASYGTSSKNPENTVPWSWYLRGGIPVTHENDDCYIVGTVHVHRGETVCIARQRIWIETVVARPAGHGDVPHVSKEDVDVATNVYLTALSQMVDFGGEVLGNHRRKFIRAALESFATRLAGRGDVR